MSSQSPLSKMKVWYGFDKLGKVRKKRALRVRFENSANHYERKMRHIRLMGKTVERFQTIEEAEDAKGSYREFTDYTVYIDAKPFFGDIEAVLEHNFAADSNHVSVEERERIRKELRTIFNNSYQKWTTS